MSSDYRICLCECHTVIPVSIYDRIAAATACGECRDAHVQRYVKEQRPAKPAPDTSTAWTDQSDGEGRE